MMGTGKLALRVDGVRGGSRGYRVERLAGLWVERLTGLGVERLTGLGVERLTRLGVERLANWVDRTSLRLTCLFRNN